MYPYSLYRDHHNGPSMNSTGLSPKSDLNSATRNMNNGDEDEKLFLYEKKRYTKTLFSSRMIRNLSISVVILKS